MNAPSPEQQTNPEQQYRAELTHAISAESIGTVGVYTSMDMDRTQRNNWLTALAERNSDNPDASINPNASGWSDYGERSLVTGSVEALKPIARFEPGMPNETMRFVETDNGDVDIRYIFTSAGYVDATGRPGNVLTVGFQVSAETARTLKEALEADPSYVNEVIEAQVLGVGIDKQIWDRKLKPHYFEKFQETTAHKDRQLAIAGYDSKGVLHVDEKLTYGENKSILPSNSTEQIPALMAHEVAETPAYPEDEDLDIAKIGNERVADALNRIEQGEDEDVLGAKLESRQRVLESYLNNLPASHILTAEDRQLEEEFFGNDAVLKELYRRENQQGTVESSTPEVVSAVSPENSRLTFGAGERVKFGEDVLEVVDSYSTATGIEWAELSNGTQVMASKLTRA